ncbi:hypothetical protein [Mycobacterium asiaticum]|nr:hypothetical protein [Mycobacterium asiaticum]
MAAAVSAALNRGVGGDAELGTATGVGRAEFADMAAVSVMV